MAPKDVQRLYDNWKKEGWVPPTPTTRKVLNAFMSLRSGLEGYRCESLAMESTEDIRDRFGADWLQTAFSIIQRRIDERSKQQQESRKNAQAATPRRRR